MKTQFTGRWVSECCGELMDYTQSRCPACMEFCEPEAEINEEYLENAKQEANKIIKEAEESRLKIQC